MDFWLIQEGGKTGPFRDYEIRERIEEGELARDDKVWHEGADGWVSLGDLDLFRSSFEDPEEAVVVEPPPLPNRPRPIIRFWARWFDFHLYGALVFGAMHVFEVDLRAALESPMFHVTWLLPWLMLEAIALHLWKTTPGKWLLAIEVQKPGGERLILGEALLRGFRVYVLGLGMMLWIFPLIGQAFGLWYTLRFGESAWDRLAGNEARVGKQTGPRVAAFILLFLTVMMLWAALTHAVSEELFEEMLKQIREQHPGLFEKKG